MPTSGGSADKLGNRYEALWAVDQLLRIIEGAARQMILEPLNNDESRGIEFVVTDADHTINYWSIKRQTTKAAGWTLSVLAAQDERGRTILGDLLRHVERDRSHRAVFASTLGAPEFDELRAHAASTATLDARLDRSSSLKSEFRKYLLPLCGNDTERAREFLQRTRVHTADEAQLRERVDFAIRHLIFATDGSILRCATVRGLLGDLLLDNIHRLIDRDTILGMLASHGFQLREWAVDRSIRDRIDAMCEAYAAPLQSHLINGALFPLAGSESILGADNKPINKKVLVVGGAGSGKSSTLAGMVERLRAAGIIVLPVRFDQLPDGILTTTELGRKLLLPESPALVLAGVAIGAPSALIIDQLDAVSIASGRRAELWSLFEELRREAERFPSMSLFVGCREFDLEHDHRMRGMTADNSGFAIIKLKALSMDQVDKALRDIGMEPTVVQPSFKPILAVPLHLSMFLRLTPSDRSSVGNRDDLFDRFWIDTERRTDQRLGRKAAWTKVIDQLARWLSANQQLSAPQYVLDDVSADAAAMASENVVVLAEGRYRFFHESFFDYAFARRFTTAGGRLIDLLLDGEQHLFRRAQVRQVLAFLRSQEWSRYLKELQSILLHPSVRFHIKRLVFQWLSAITDPRRQEWEVLQKLVGSAPSTQPHVRTVVTGHPVWFDVLDAASFFDAALSSGDAAREEEAVWMLAFHPTLEARSARIAALLRKHRKSGDRWNQYLRHICRNGDVYHSREMFDLFLSLIDDGTLDGLRPGFAVNDNWWSVLYSVANKRPELACEAIGRWFDRALVTWRAQHTQNSRESASVKESLTRSLWAHLDRGGAGVHVIKDAAKSPLSYATNMLPRVANLVNETAKEVEGRLQTDALWSVRPYRAEEIQVHHAILSNLAKSLETLAITAHAELERLLVPYQDRPHDTIAYLVLRAWTAAADVYADRLADYMASDCRRLKIGYAFWSSGGGSAAIYVSSQALRAASMRCSSARFEALERAIISFVDSWEARRPQFRGRTQLELLEAMDKSRLSPNGRAKLDELRAKFPSVYFAPPRASRGFVRVDAPIPEDAQMKMSDEQWLRAMQKYAGIDHRNEREFRLSGGERELAHSLEMQVKANPIRYIRLAERMSDDLPHAYFDAIVSGVVDCASVEKDEGVTVAILDAVVSLVRRVHALPGRPCGKSIARLIERWNDCDWPEDVLDVVAWHAVNDPDPDKELWKMPADGGHLYYGGDPYTAGINSARGATAGAIARLLFDNQERFERLHDAVHSLAHDRSTAVRSCTIGALLALLDVDFYKSIEWFADCVSSDSAILETPDVEQFVHHAGFRDYVAIRPVIERMLMAEEARTVEAGARQVCLLALGIEAAEEDARRVQSGTTIMRRAAADVYSSNVADNVVGAACRQLLKPFFVDPDESVRTEAASAFQRLARLATTDQADLLTAFLDAAPGPSALEAVVHALQDSPVQLPDLVVRAAELCVESYGTNADNISKNGSMFAIDLPKIVVRLYAQTEDAAIQSRCLDMIDEMERYYFLGLSDELKRVDR
ncbi:ATP-binding protein [Sorangium cellulosum]|nr:ATP-binding protein [Sorangium cellulosum]